MKTKKPAIEILRALEEKWWGKVMLLPLSLVSYVFKLLVYLRVYLYKLGLLKAEELKCRVICVGNITSGGTGKTPTVRLLADKLQKQGVRVVIISRGYKGNLEGRLEVVADEGHILRSAAEVGDEPYLLAQQLPGIPIVVGKRRSYAGWYASMRFKPQLIILDDGYQHLKLFRQVNIMVIDATNPFGNRCLLPRGTLREPLSALSRAQIFLLTKTDLVGDLSAIVDTLRCYNPKAPILTSVHQPLDIGEVGKKKKHPLKWLQGKKVVCFCGIADPASFVKMIKGVGAELVGQLDFPDHYKYSKADLGELAATVKKLGAEALITTEKDAVRIAEFDHPGLPMLTLNIELKITSDEQEWEAAWKIVVGAE
jgi:tetraacyldisaccharide 4'-kinase